MARGLGSIQHSFATRRFEKSTVPMSEGFERSTPVLRQSHLSRYAGELLERLCDARPDPEL